MLLGLTISLKHLLLHNDARTSFLGLYHARLISLLQFFMLDDDVISIRFGPRSSIVLIMRRILRPLEHSHIEFRGNRALLIVYNSDLLSTWLIVGFDGGMVLLTLRIYGGQLVCHLMILLFSIFNVLFLDFKAWVGHFCCLLEF